MSATAQDLDFIKTAAVLARAAPIQWAEFIKATAERSAKVRDDLVRAPAQSLQVAQGRAQESAAIAELLKDAVTTADRITR